MQSFKKLPKGRTVRDEPVDWAARKADLIKLAKTEPGSWGLVATNISGSTPGQLRAGKYKDFQGEELDNFEFVTRKPKSPDESYSNRRTDLYGRYIGA